MLETKKIADLCDLFFLPLRNHNTGSVICTMATVQWAGAIRDYLACETVAGKRDWMDDVIPHDGPLAQDGHIKLPNKPGLGLELNEDVVKAHLAEGGRYWSYLIFRRETDPSSESCAGFPPPLAGLVPVPLRFR